MLRKMLLVAAVAALVGLTGSARADNGSFKVLAPAASASARPEMLATAGKITMLRLDGEDDPNEAALEACRGGGRGGGGRGFSRGGGRGFGRGYARGGRGYGRGYGRGWGRGYRHHYGRGSYGGYYYGGCYYPDCYDYSYCEDDYSCYQPSYCDYSCYQPGYYYYGCSGQIGSLSVVDAVHTEARAEIKRTETKLTLPTKGGKSAK